MAESSSSSSSNNSVSLSSSPVTRIPQDHLFSILLLLPIESILSFSMTCKKLKSLADSDSLWESVCRRDWGNTPVETLKASNHLPWKKLYQQVYQLDSVFCRRLLTDTSDGTQSFPTPRASHSLNLVSGCLLLFGGGCTGGPSFSLSLVLFAHPVESFLDFRSEFCTRNGSCSRLVQILADFKVNFLIVSNDFW